MSTPMIQILIYLSSTFILGLALGWVLWKFGIAKELAATASEVSFWKQNLEQTRRERDADQEKIAALEQEKRALMARVGA